MREVIIILLSLLGATFVLSSPAGKVLHSKSGTEKPVGNVGRRFVRSVDLKAAKSSTEDSRLPRDVIPIGYKLQLHPFPEEGYFKGRVWINVTCQEPTTSITLHAHEDLRIAHSEVRVKDITDFAPQNSTLNNATKLTSVPLVVASTKKEPSKQWYVITLADSLKKEGIYQLDLSFSGDLATGFTQGFFRASYQLHRTREERWFAATKMSPSNARHVFPCFDEPDLKAPFEISVAREEKMMALSNMPVESRSKIENGGSWSWIHFQRTPPMSTFSVAVVVSDLEHLVANNTGSATISVFARPTFLSQVQGVLEKAPRMLNFLESYLGVPFPLPKLDLVALPHYSDPEPADHWGLIILKESDFVNDDALAWRLADEMVQQWFGHLATPAWWTDASINKALANYMATLVSTEGKLNWNLLTGYSLYYEYSKRHPQTTQAEFLAITRIQWLLRMLNYTLTENTFRDGLRTFLQEKKMKTYNQSDLWEALTEQAHLDQTLAADINVEDIATSWISRERFPVVTVIRDYEDNSASVEQHMFLRERPNEHNERESLLWWVPLLYLSPDNIDLNEQRPPIMWMHEEKHATLTNLPGPEFFLIVNPEEIGMFMVNYDAHNWALLAEYLYGQGPTIPGGTRAKLLHDAWNLALGGELDVATALNLTVFLEDPKRETELPVWHAFFTMVDHLGHQVSGTPSGLKLEEYARIILTRLSESLGSAQPDEDSDRKKLRLLVHDLLCPLGHTTCVQEAQQSYAKWMASEDPDAGNPVADLQLCTVFKWGTMEEWEFGMQRVIHFPTERKQSERSYLLKTLAGCPRQSEKVERILNMTVLEDNGNWTDSDVRLVLNMLTGSATGYNTLFNFLVQNWDELKQRFEGKAHMWEYLIHRATEMFKTQEGLHMVSELYVKRQGEFGSAESVVEQSLRIINAEAQWSDQNLSNMEAWLDARLSSLN